MDSTSPLIKSPLPHKSPKPRSGLSLEDSPSIPKRRRMDMIFQAALNTSYPPPFISSPTESPNPLYFPCTPERRSRDYADSPGGRSRDYTDSPGGRSRDYSMDSPNASYLDTPTESPDVRARRRYKKDELWKAIKPDYQFIMDGEIVEACKSTEGDLSWDDDDDATNTKVSFTEFMQQYKELMEWCNQLQAVTHGTGMSLSEKYLNQVYREELLKQSPRKRCLSDYAKQLLRRYPALKAEINARLQHLNHIWEDLVYVVMPDGEVDGERMLRDLNQDLSELQKWLLSVESRLEALYARPEWGPDILERKLCDHQVLQSEIESHGRIVSAVLKLCERIEKEDKLTSNLPLAVKLEQNWHAIWLQSLESQCRLEYAINQKKGDTSQNWDSGYPFHPTCLTSLNFNFDHPIEEGHESDGDILPFSEDEYEKIPVDTDTQTDTGDTVTENEDLNQEKMYQGELSDAVEVLSEVEEVDEAPITEGKDGGYGSESHSNDEDHLKSESAQTEQAETSSCEVQTDADTLVLDGKMRVDVGSSDDVPVSLLDINASPGEKFYKFVIMDSDSEKVRYSDSESKRSATVASVPRPNEVPRPRTRLDILLTELEHVVEESADYFQKDSRLSHLTTNDHEIRTEFSQKHNGNSERIQKLILKAETLVEPKWRRRNRRRMQVDCSAVTDDSCDASSEFTESEVDYSSAISDTEYTQPCLTSPNTSAQTIVNSPQYVSPVMRPRSNSSRKRERPRSYQEQGNCEKFELRTYSISEGALADLREIRASSTPKSSRRVQSMRSRTRRIRRSRSDSERLGLSQSSSEKTVNGASGDNLVAPSGERGNIWPDVEYIGAEGDVFTPMDADDSDHLNSTVESFSETAWDDYQDPMYASVNDSYVEEKLDDNHLQWEASSNMEFDDEFLTQTADPLPERSQLISLTSVAGRASDDSDSDLEDIKYVLDQSRKQLQVADSVLRRPPQDEKDTGIFLHPQKYAEILATCQTNIRCLQDVCETLEQTDRDVTQDPNYLLFKEMTELWIDDYQLALEKQELSRRLSTMNSSLQSVRALVAESDSLLGRRAFDDQRELEAYLRELQKQSTLLQERQLEADQIVRTLETFRQENRDVPIDHFSQEITSAATACRRTSESLSSRMHEVESMLFSFYDYHETRKELAYCLEKERSLLAYLERNVDVLEDGLERQRIGHDLQTMLDDLHLYEGKLALLRKLGTDVISVSDHKHQDQIRAETAILANELAALRKRCHDNVLKWGRVNVVAEETLGVTSPAADPVVTETSSVSTQTTEEPRVPKKRSRYAFLKKLLGLTLPLQCALLLVYGLLCLGEMAVSPHLSYVRGPPPF